MTDPPVKSGSPAPDWTTYPRDLFCPRCGYNLRTLTGHRCPECGLDLDWSALRAAAEREIDSPLFEHQWRKRPLRSFAASIAVALRHRRAFATLRIELPACWGGMAAHAGLLLFLLWTMPVVSAAIGNLLYQLRRGVPWARLKWYRWIWYDLTGYQAHILVYAATAATVIACLYLFRQTRRYHRVRAAQICRVSLLSFTAFVAIRTIESLAYALDCATGGAWLKFSLAIQPTADILGILLFTRTLGWGLKAYLRIPRGMAMAVLAVLLTAVIWNVAVIVHAVKFSDRFPDAFAQANGVCWPGLDWLAGQLTRR